jgi:glycine cleavage system H lipoate-binding protein
MKVKMEESRKALAPVTIGPKAFLDLYLSGVDDLSFIVEIQSQMAQKPSGTIDEIKIQKTGLALKKEGGVVRIENVKPSKSQKHIVMNVLASLGRVLAQNKKAVDISTAA